MKSLFSAFIALSLLIGLPGGAQASSGHTETPAQMNWSFDGMFGTYDRASLQRGLKIYREVCSACHSLNKIAFRNLSFLGYNEEEIKAIAANYEVQDGPNEEGEMFFRTATPADYFPAPFPNKEAAMYANNGAVPPDMSLLAKARTGGADYIYAILNGYGETPAGFHLMDGQYYNKYIAGNVLAMAPPLMDGMVTYEDGAPETLMQYAKDVSTFLAWTAEPTMEERKKTGVKILIYLLIMSGLMYAVKRAVWSDQH